MTMADILQVLLLILGALILVVSYWLLFEALAPRWVERSRKQYAERPFRVVFTGLILLVVPLLATLIIIQSPAQAIGFFMLFALILVGLLGSTGLARHVGTGIIRHQSGSDAGWHPAESIEGWLVPDSLRDAGKLRTSKR
jgi:hypothetical protein